MRPAVRHEEQLERRLCDRLRRQRQHALDDPQHRNVQKWVRDLNRLYRAEPALFETDFYDKGFEWIDFHDSDQSTLSFLRKGRNAGDLVVCSERSVLEWAYGKTALTGAEFVPAATGRPLYASASFTVPGLVPRVTRETECSREQEKMTAPPAGGLKVRGPYSGKPTSPPSKSATWCVWCWTKYGT